MLPSLLKSSQVLGSKVQGSGFKGYERLLAAKAASF
jgi:hypothetical protein